jgi:hypothetical protein
MNCKGKTTAGAACKMPALKGKRHCFTHDPETSQARTAARTLGGYNRGTPHAGNAETIAEKPRTMDGVFTILDYVKAETIAMENGVQRNRLLVSIAAEYKDAIKQGDIEKQLQELLAILSSRPDPAK